MTKPAILVLYHGKCPDGFAAAWVAWLALGHHAAEYMAVHHGGQPPLDAARGRTVYVLDFCYPVADMKALQDVALDVVVYDHHKTAMEMFQDHVGTPEFSNTTFVFYMDRSGAGIALEKFTPGVTNWVARYVEDRDLWRFRLPHSEAVNAYLMALPHDFAAWRYVWKNETPAMASERGQAILQYKKMMVEQIAAQAVITDFADYAGVPVVNSQYVGISEVLSLLAAKHPPFAVGYHVGPAGNLHLSFRSVGDFDVSIIAKRLGGGGHRNAAGATLTRWRMAGPGCTGALMYQDTINTPNQISMAYDLPMTSKVHVPND